MTAYDATGETAFNAGAVIARATAAGELNRLSWLPVSGATGYRVYRAATNGARTDFKRLMELGSEAISYIDDGVEEIGHRFASGHQHGRAHHVRRRRSSWAISTWSTSDAAASATSR